MTGAVPKCINDIDSHPSYPEGINSRTPQIPKSVDAQVPCKKLYNGGPSTSADVEPANRRANCMNLVNPRNCPGMVVIHYYPAPFAEEESKVQRIKVTRLVNRRAKRKAQSHAQSHSLRYSTLGLSTGKSRGL